MVGMLMRVRLVVTIAVITIWVRSMSNETRSKHTDLGLNLNSFQVPKASSP